ncbi:hypothetical protein N9A94_03860 [Akkermansiaceae bacterium]|nr:hypothetical protein [Akkermansiaceae bacterium]MDA7888773.1 hypothetical protein [Akkermansiaceae bacterium]MDB4538214.1 hypothetical protein [Akkermansiaceae bacterium]
MEHIVNSKSDGIDYTRYAAYLATIREMIPVHVYSFASDSRYFDLNSRSTLHDSWLESLTLREVASGERGEIRRMEVAICLLGPFQDRRIHLHYSGVTLYRFDAPPHYGEQRFEHTAHGDLFTHEIRLGHDGLLIHELLFENDSTFLIECSDVRHSEEMIADKDSEQDAAMT